MLLLDDDYMIILLVSQGIGLKYQCSVHVVAEHGSGTYIMQIEVHDEQCILYACVSILVYVYMHMFLLDCSDMLYTIIQADIACRREQIMTN